jgi:hypothetical protein
VTLLTKVRDSMNCHTTQDVLTSQGILQGCHDQNRRMASKVEEQNVIIHW